jgi:hypothetical protein
MSFIGEFLIKKSKGNLLKRGIKEWNYIVKDWSL